jgi:carbon-monoxide dehydrogenase small subunit
MAKRLVRFTLNGVEREAWVQPYHLLLHVLRDELGATEVKYGCGEGVCSTCSVLLDGESVNSCLMFAVQAEGRSVTTARGLVGEDEALHPLQENFLRFGAAQCGYCTPAMLLRAAEFLAENSAPTRQEIRSALSGNICRCTGYTKIVDAIEAYASGAASVAQQATEHGAV